MRTIPIEKSSGTFFKTCEPQSLTVTFNQILKSFLKPSIRFQNQSSFCKRSYLNPFLDLAVAKSLQSTRTVTDADDADDVLTTC